MLGLLARFNLSPPGVKRSDGSWSLLKVTGNANYADFLVQHAYTIAQFQQRNDSTSLWAAISSPKVGGYLYSRHPKLQFLDFSEPCDLTLLTHIQANGMNEKYWVGKATAGASHFMKIEARNRAISEVLERTFLAELQCPLDTMWSSAIAPTVKLAKQCAIEECLERWITYQAWKNVADFQLMKIDSNNFMANGYIKTVFFEWERYGATINLFHIKNPYNLPVILIRIQVALNNQCWTFFSNGIGNSLLQAIKKALFESIQFVPGKDHKSWQKEVIEHSSHVSRLKEWQELTFDFQNLKQEENNSLQSQDDAVYCDHLFNVTRSIQADVMIHSLEECPGVYLGCTSLAQQHWSKEKGIPIA